ncbi:MAG TPA: 4-oxalomesaconate tautomerase, partial [Alphaproteobacteria bacterium]|nr:4-oxalomesaconate tautomerase [Alphaproteobacteria bacterium]
MWMRGGTSKGAYFLADDLPRDKAARDALLLRIMGSPDPRQIDGMGGANPLTSKVAVISASTRPDADLDYLFLQVFVDKALVSDAQNCGNILAGVGAFAIERGLVSADDGITDIRIFMRNTGQVATASITTPNGIVRYDGDDSIDGVPGTAAPVPLVFDDIAGSMCGALLPTGNAVDVVEHIEVTMIDNGMPIVVLRAEDMGITGYEPPSELDNDDALKSRLEALRLACGHLMGLGDVRQKSVPKMTMVAPAQNG